MTGSFANAFECSGVDNAGNALKIKTIVQANTTHVILYSDSKIYKEIVKFKSFQGSSIGHSRCPGTWSGVTYEGLNSNSIFKSLSIITEEQFFGCGAAPFDSVTLISENNIEIIQLTCNQ